MKRFLSLKVTSSSSGIDERFLLLELRPGKVNNIITSLFDYLKLAASISHVAQ